jgi:hypothetical protein
MGLMKNAASYREEVLEAVTDDGLGSPSQPRAKRTVRASYRAVVGGLQESACSELD